MVVCRRLVFPPQVEFAKVSMRLIFERGSALFEAMPYGDRSTDVTTMLQLTGL